jgi:hypothetical protein
MPGRYATTILMPNKKVIMLGGSTIDGSRGIGAQNIEIWDPANPGVSYMQIRQGTLNQGSGLPNMSHYSCCPFNSSLGFGMLCDDDDDDDDDDNDELCDDGAKCCCRGSVV